MDLQSTELHMNFEAGTRPKLGPNQTKTNYSQRNFANYRGNVQ